MTLLAFAAERSAAARVAAPLSIDYLPPAGPTAANAPHAARTDRRTEGQTPYRCIDASSVKKRLHRFHRTAENVGTYKHYFIKDKILTSLYN